MRQFASRRYTGIALILMTAGTLLAQKANSRQAELDALLVEAAAQASRTPKTPFGKTLAQLGLPLTSPDLEIALLKKGAHANASDPKTGNTALMFAAHSANVAILKLLLDNGADVNARNLQGASAIMSSFAYGSEPSVKYLLAQGAVLTPADASLIIGNTGDTPVTVAARHKWNDIFALLVGDGYNLNSPNAFGWTPLIEAVCGGNLTIADSLISRGADTKASTRGGATALNCAIDGGHAAIVSALLARGADPNAQSTSGASPLIDAVSHKQAAILNLLLAAGADPYRKNASGLTAKDLASRMPESTLKTEMLKAFADAGQTEPANSSVPPPDAPHPTVTTPSVLFKTDPPYSEEARRAKYSGSVMLSVIIGTGGDPVDIRVVRPLGFGLDEQAIAAVRRWKFKPGTSNGVPVEVRAQIEVNFRLL